MRLSTRLAPLIFLVAIVTITYALFWVGPYAPAVTNGGLMTTFLVGVLVVFAVGYSLAWVGSTKLEPVRSLHPPVFPRGDRRLLKWSYVWYIAFAVISITAYGVHSPGELIQAILHPRASYYAKFGQGQVSGGLTIVFQVLNLCGALYFILIPFAALYWRAMGRAMRIGAVISVAAYVVFFLSTGTQQGLANMAIAFAVSVFAVRLRNRGSKASVRRILATIVVVGILGLLGLTIVASFAARTDTTSTLFQSSASAQMVKNFTPFVGPYFARGATVLIAYVSHGYFGLASSMKLPFVWTGGMGAFRGLSSYLPQYLGLVDPYYSTYPVRLQEVSSWSATGVWSTIYPWLASDLSFPGVVLASGVLGFAVARVWRTFLISGSSLALVLISIFAVGAAYSEANNQLFNERYSAIGVLTILIVYALSRVGASSSHSFQKSVAGGTSSGLIASNRSVGPRQVR
ncbi:hypothetical protein [Leifsonia sp. AG29]|uniref:hypothetical protein n=1 Tax=Leifsonia sp. AG29 TaxID=2598860 RepID=UPI00131AD9D0|nr:hypothetical protein [Leifsonia sp. AG29]